MSNYDCSTFTKRININAEKEVIFNSFTSQSSLENWFLSNAHLFLKVEPKDRSEKVERGGTYS